jgi:5-methylthioadenosine/S-adenosylhomocysteine deaminase
VIFAPHAPYSVSLPVLSRINEYATEMDKRIHIHLHETLSEVEESRQQYGLSPMERLDQIGLLTPSLIAVHMVHPSPSEIALLASRGCHVAHCPESNMKLANGVCPVAELSRAGVNVALATDGAASNNDLDMFGEMRTCALISKGFNQDPQVLPAHEVLQMATLNGARALGLEDRIGSLVPGKLADIIAVNLDEPETLPVYDPVSQLVYSCGRHQVVHSWVNGRQIMANRKILTLNEKEISQRSHQWQQKLSQFKSSLIQ